MNCYGRIESGDVSYYVVIDIGDVNYYGINGFLFIIIIFRGWVIEF